VDAVPLGAEELAERVSLREADAHAEGPQLLERRGAEVVCLADAHERQAYRLGCRKWKRRRAKVADFTIYHNPRCSKSRATLALLEENGVEPRIIEYLKTPPTAAELRDIVAKLGIEPEQLIRKGEDVYRSRYADRQLSGEQWIEAMVRDPILIERPIVVRGDRAVLGRPPENVHRLLEGKAAS
jgi:arsenate reductase